MTPHTENREHWTVGADALRSLNGDGESLHVPEGRLHAVSGAGLIVGRSVCLAPVSLLDPAQWSWPDDPADAPVAAPLCWICRALTA
jgi:hypothetical protein